MSTIDKAERIRTALERNTKAVTLRPAVGQKTSTSKTRLIDGLRCEIEEGKWKVHVDASDKSGGDGTAPDPGVIVRAALGGCLAMAYAIFAAKMRIPIHSLEVDIETDFDARGQYDVGDVHPGFSEVRYTLSIESPAPEADVMRMVKVAERNCMTLDVFARAQKMVGNVKLSTPQQ